MPDFGDDFGDGLKRVSNTILRELFHQWLRDSQRGNNMGHERINNEDYDVMYFDDEAQRQLFEQKLRDAGIECEEKTVPGIRFKRSDRKTVEKMYEDLIGKIDTGKYTPTKAEQDFVGNMGLGDQMAYDLQRAVFEGTLTQAEVDALGPEPTYNDLVPLFQKHPDFERTISGTWKQRLEDDAKRAEKGAADKANVAEQPAWTRKPATEKQMNALHHAEERGLLSDTELALAHKDGLNIGEASSILDQHKDVFRELNLDAEAKSNLAQAEQKAEAQQAERQEPVKTQENEEPEQAVDDKAAEQPTKSIAEEAEIEEPEAEQAAEEAVPEKDEQELDDIVRDGKDDVSPELEHAAKNGTISQEELNSIGKDERHDVKALEEKHPEVAQKLRDAGYDMNDLTKNDARMCPSHDGMDPDHHTEAVESNWKDQINQAAQDSIREIRNENPKLGQDGKVPFETFRDKMSSKGFQANYNEDLSDIQITKCDRYGNPDFRQCINGKNLEQALGLDKFAHGMRAAASLKQRPNEAQQIARDERGGDGPGRDSNRQFPEKHDPPSL